MSETNLRDPFQAMSVSPEFFKDVKYFVSGTLDEEVMLKYISISKDFFNFFCFHESGIGN